MESLTRTQINEMKRIETAVINGATIRLCEPCDCGAQVRHNNGGNYHTIVEVENPGRYINEKGASSGTWRIRTGTTCELVPKTEWEETDYSGAMEAIRMAVQEEWEIEIYGGVVPATKEFTFEGYEVIERLVKPHATSAHVGMPKKWIGCRVAIVRLDEGLDSDSEQ